MRTFNHLTQEERYHIYIMHKKNVSMGAVAKDMGLGKSSISGELQRNKGVDEKSRLGDWEADTAIGKGHQGVP